MTAFGLLLATTCTYYAPLQACDNAITARQWREALTWLGVQQKVWGFRRPAQLLQTFRLAGEFVKHAAKADGSLPLDGLMADEYDRMNVVFVLLHYGDQLADKNDDRGAIARWRSAECLCASSEESTAHVCHRIRDSQLMWKLARAYERLGRWNEAAGCWRQYSSHSTCGTCQQHSAESALYHTLLNRCRAGDTSGAVKEYFHLLSNGASENSRVAYWLFQLYRDAEQIDDLFALLGSFDECLLREAARDGQLMGKTAKEILQFCDTARIRSYQEIEGMAMRGEVAELLSLCQDRRMVDIWEGLHQLNSTSIDARLAAESLAALGVSGVCQCAKVLNDPQVNGCWFIYSLGKNPTPEAFQLLVSLSHSENGYQCRYVAYAMSLRGEEGRKQLEAWANDREAWINSAAADRLLQMSKPTIPDPPRPRKGSLPRTYEAKPASRED